MPSERTKRKVRTGKKQLQIAHLTEALYVDYIKNSLNSRLKNSPIRKLAEYTRGHFTEDLCADSKLAQGTPDVAHQQGNPD